MPKVFIYAHGLSSSSKSEKARRISSWMQEEGFETLLSDYSDVATEWFRAMVRAVVSQIQDFLKEIPKTHEIWIMGSSNGFGVLLRALVELDLIENARVFGISPVHDVRVFFRADPTFEKKVMQDPKANLPAMLRDLQDYDWEYDFIEKVRAVRSLFLFWGTEDAGVVEAIWVITKRLSGSGPTISTKWYAGSGHDLGSVFLKQDMLDAVRQAM